MIFEKYFSGKKLYGDDFSAKQIQEWYSAEIEGYANLGAASKINYKYVYHAWNRYHGFSRLPQNLNFEHVVGFGSAYGYELEPIMHRCKGVTIIEPSDQLRSPEIGGVPVTYLKPDPSGIIPLADRSVDLLVCLSVLHHIPNVSFVIREFGRVLKPGGSFILREPIVSMGDWRLPRQGLTKNERGIPEMILRRAVKDAGLTVNLVHFCDFPLTRILFRRLRSDIFNSIFITKFDYVVSKLFRWNYRYHAVNIFQKIRPASIYIVGQRL